MLESTANVFYRCVESCAEAVMITDENQVLTYVNPSWVNIYGYSKEEALGKTPDILRSDLHGDDFYQNIWAQIKTSGYWKGELFNRAKDGTLIPVITTFTAYKDGDDEISGYMGIAIDITARKQLEAEVIHQDRLASVGVLASGLAHEIGTPLGVIRGRAEFLQMELEKETQAEKALDIIIGQIDRVSHLISTLLSFSRSALDLNIKLNEIKPLVQEVLVLVQEKINYLKVEVRLNIPDGTTLRCDYNRTQQVLINMLINSLHAIEASRENNPHKKHFISISLHEEKNQACLKVEDSGTGIAPENMKKIFHPFFTTKDIGKGTGLGLAIVSKLVNEMGARISVESIFGEGTTFNIMFKR